MALLRVLVVDDSAFMRSAISRMLSSDPQIQVVGSAPDGAQGLKMAQDLRPDVITLDVEMPVMDGMTALRRIMRECPTQVIMLSSLTTQGSHAALHALSLGAADVLAKDNSQVSLSITNMREELVKRVKALAGASASRRQAPPAPPQPVEPPQFRPGQFDVVCIGSSTGGPPVLEALLSALPAGFTTPVVIAQHMPELFTRSMAERLGGMCRMKVRHIDERLPLERGCAYIARGGKHVHLTKLGLARFEVRMDDEPRQAPYRPSVDALFASAAAATGSRTLAIVLTGMGQDGLEGARSLHAAKASLLAQSEETCVVYGMPKAVTENGLVMASLAPPQISGCLATLAR